MINIFSSQLNVAGLELFAQHSTLFTEYLYDDYPEILRCLRAWNAHDNYDVKKIAQRAYDTFLLGVGHLQSSLTDNFI